MIVNFFLDNTITYRDRRLKGARAVRGLLLFLLVCSVGAIANIGIAQMLYDQGRMITEASVAGAIMALSGITPCLPQSSGDRNRLSAEACMERRWWLAALAALAALTLFRLMVAACVPLTPDEAYYRLWALAPAASYFDHPPMVALWIRLAWRWRGIRPLACVRSGHYPRRSARSCWPMLEPCGFTVLMDGPTGLSGRVWPCC